MGNVVHLPAWKPFKEFPEEPESKVRAPKEIPGRCNLRPGPVVLRKAIEIPPVLVLFVVTLVVLHLISMLIRVGPFARSLILTDINVECS